MFLEKLTWEKGHPEHHDNLPNVFRDYKRRSLRSIMLNANAFSARGMKKRIALGTLGTI
jgi:hypothetical protein